MEQPTIGPLDRQDIESPEAGFEGSLVVNSSPTTVRNTTGTVPWKRTDDYRDWQCLFKDGQLVFMVTSTNVYAEGLNDNGKKYVSYETAVFRIDKSVREFDDRWPKLSRRYTDFLELFERLKKDYPLHLAGFVFAKKSFTGNFTDTVIGPRMLCFESLLNLILSKDELRDSEHFLRFLQDKELEQACHLLDERRSEAALPILQNCLLVLNKIFTDCSKPVLLVLCRIVAASSYPIPQADANKWADMALRRFEKVCDADLLALYIPLIKACIYLFWKTGREKAHLDEQLEKMRKRGFNVTTGLSLQQAIHSLDPRTETA